MALAVGAVEELATMAREEALAAASGGGRGGPGGCGERRAREWRGDWPDILRSRFSLLIYYRQINLAIFTPDAENWLSEVSALNTDGPSCHRDSHPARK
jgi:hypothetical protein